MQSKIKQHLIDNPSYFKWGAERLAKKYNCSLRTIHSILRKNNSIRENYLTLLKNNK